MKYTVLCDGSYKKKVGASIGIVITNSVNEVITKFSEFITITNYKDKGNVNNTELFAIFKSLKILLELNLQNDEIVVYSDSMYIINKISAHKPFVEDIYTIIDLFKDINFKWLPKHDTKLAHKLCYEIIIEKTREKRAQGIAIEHKEGDLYIAHSPGFKKIYEVDLKRKTCSCIMYRKHRKCRHLDAVNLKSQILK